ncbi:MAG: nucleoside hydrolase [Clostridia bacterium]|nr:nucleoside hydrolase [Clostridia bacterium]
MTIEQRVKNLSVPAGKVDVILDTDAYNEIDDQFAISYMMKYTEKFDVKAICAAPFHNEKSTSYRDGMERSYDEIIKLLDLMDRSDFADKVYKGSLDYLPDESTPVESAAADFMANLANEYSPENPLYIVAIGAITNVASAILKNPNMIENCVVVWLGGNGRHMPLGSWEFNMFQDIPSARVIFGCGVPLVQLPCGGVVDHFTTTRYELEHWLRGKNKLCDYLVDNTIEAAESYAAGKPWSRVIWDVTAVAWLANHDETYMRDMLVASQIPQADKTYSFDERRHLITYVYEVYRDELMNHLFEILSR